MIRLTLLSLFLTFFCLYSFKDWYKSLCVLIVFVSIIEHPDIPKSMLGIQGLNPWNIFFLFVLMGFVFRNRAIENTEWDFPGYIRSVLLIYISFCLIAYFRMSGDIGEIIEWNLLRGEDPPSFLGLFSEHVINVLKWIVPGLLLFYGCNSQKRFIWGLSSALLIYFFLALLTIKAMPIGALTDADRLEYLARKLLSDNVGYHRVNLAMMFAGAFWAIFSLSELSDDKSKNKYIYIICMVILFALALSGGRTGYATWAAIGFVFSVLKWRKFLIYGPLVVFIIVLILPAARDRLLMGFSESTSDSRNQALLEEGLINENSNVDLYTVTSGRTIAWPFVIDKIQQRPFIGYGKEAMIREGLTSYLWTSFQEAFPHPHNMYLQWLMDNGFVGFIPVMIFYITLLSYSFSLLKDTRNRNFVVIGGAGTALILALLISGFGSQTFYPREGAVGMWCIIGLLLRLYVQRSKFEKIASENKAHDIPIENDILWSKHDGILKPLQTKPKFNYYSSGNNNG